MTARPKDSDIDPATADQQQRKQQPGAQGFGKDGDAREDEGKLRQNQERLNVGPDHKTPEMEKEHRGTFP
jgi:hypothetical protein